MLNTALQPVQYAAIQTLQEPRSLIGLVNRVANHNTVCNASELRSKCFYSQVQTDGVSVSVLMFQPQPQPAQTPSASNPQGQKRKQQQQTGAEWVRDSSDRNIGQIHRVVGLDPG